LVAPYPIIAYTPHLINAPNRTLASITYLRARWVIMTVYISLYILPRLPNGPLPFL